MDTFLAVDHIVRQGETIRASGVRRSPGGKGLNQAIAAARMGAETVVLGYVGTDARRMNSFGTSGMSPISILPTSRRCRARRVRR